ncbi:hypothetical protein [Metapseudomonas resinovorans]|uniref:hypothetical protein n=1 Tax=Metapseudomonas resinovorans TaxID=53412 RepID=UPI003B845BC1
MEIDLHYPPSGEKKLIVFSSDLGALHAPLLRATKRMCRAEILVIESTYDDLLHEDRCTRRQRLKHVTEQAPADNGMVFIRAFSIDRTQELLCELEDIIRRKRLNTYENPLLSDGETTAQMQAVGRSGMPESRCGEGGEKHWQRKQRRHRLANTFHHLQFHLGEPPH